MYKLLELLFATKTIHRQLWILVEMRLVLSVIRTVSSCLLSWIGSWFLAVRLVPPTVNSIASKVDPVSINIYWKNTLLVLPLPCSHSSRKYSWSVIMRGSYYWVSPGQISIWFYYKTFSNQENWIRSLESHDTPRWNELRDSVSRRRGLTSWNGWYLQPRLAISISGLLSLWLLSPPPQHTAPSMYQSGFPSFCLNLANIL